MEFRVTVSLGQSSVDSTALDQRAAGLQRCLPGGTKVVVDVVKAAIQLVLSVNVADALEAADEGLRITHSGLRDAGIDRPTTIVHVEAEAVAAPITGDNLLPHPAP
ncbi:MAG: hypothetical protein ABJA87_12335 [bacterium]